MNFIRLNENNFIFQVTVLKFDDCLGVCKLGKNAKYQYSISKIMKARQK